METCTCHPVPVAQDIIFWHWAWCSKDVLAQLGSQGVHGWGGFAIADGLRAARLKPSDFLPLPVVALDQRGDETPSLLSQ